MGSCVRIAAAWLLAGLALAASPAPAKFAGTWEAKSKGTLFLILKIKTGEKISGTIRSGHVHIGDHGELLEVSPPEDQENPIFFAHVDGDKLVFNYQDDDDQILQFELTLTGDDAGELRIVDKDHPALKGF
ncbi:MAG: hypothetical protein KGN36_02810, partial [Acidobacteriota bacterium]|nr:hypothetical protein [Acidobacteriota bacterium]